MTPKRFELWAKFLEERKPKYMLEIGVFRGDYSKYILDNVPSIETYYMIDPWRILDEWNKPLNTNQIVRDYDVAMSSVQDHKEKVKVLRGTTLEVIDQIKNDSLDFCYIDGDHTLRGITIDLQKVFPKIKRTGVIGGDDFCNKRQHKKRFEPTLVFPYAVFFAESVNCSIQQLPHNQFLLNKSKKYSFDCTDNRYKDTSINNVI